MKHPVQLDFLQANQTVAALQERTARLSAARGDPLTYRAIVDCLAAETAVRMAFDFPEPSKCCGAGGSTPHWVGCPQHPKALADMAPGEVTEMYGS